LASAQPQLAALSGGLSVSTIRRLERGEMPNPPPRYLVNLAFVLQVDSPLELCPPEWLRWRDFTADGSQPHPPPRR
jgi:transcriptional regulator with XRE-family HTH domain